MSLMSMNTHLDSSDQLHRSHMSQYSGQYCWGCCKLEYCWGYFEDTLKVHHNYCDRSTIHAVAAAYHQRTCNPIQDNVAMWYTNVIQFYKYICNRNLPASDFFPSRPLLFYRCFVRIKNIKLDRKCSPCSC